MSFCHSYLLFVVFATSILCKNTIFSWGCQNKMHYFVALAAYIFVGCLLQERRKRGAHFVLWFGQSLSMLKASATVDATNHGTWRHQPWQLAAPTVRVGNAKKHSWL